MQVIDIRHWLTNSVAVDTIIHNDYTTELVPKFEIFADRLEMTSAGYIHPGEEREDFFAGYSIPATRR